MLRYIGHQGQMNAAVAVVAAQMNAQHNNGQSAQQQQSPQGGYLAPYGYSPYEQAPMSGQGQRSVKDNGAMNQEGAPTSQDGYTSAYDMSQPKHAHTNHSSGAATPPDIGGIQSRYSYGYTTTNNNNNNNNNNNGPTTPVKSEHMDRSSPHSPYNQMYIGDLKSDLNAKHSLPYAGQYGAYAGVAAIANQQYQGTQSMEPTSSAMDPSHIDQTSLSEEGPINNDEEAYIDVSQAHL